MTDLNSVSIGGRITKDAAIEKTKDGLSMVKITMAINRSKKKKDSDEYEDKPVFIELAPIYGNYAEAMVKHLTKGTYLTVEGYLDMDSWTTEDGVKHQKLKVVPKQGAINPWVERKSKNPESSEIENTNLMSQNQETISDAIF